MSSLIYKSEFEPVKVASEPLHKTLFSKILKYADEDRTAFILAESGKKVQYKQLRDAVCSLSKFLEQNNFGHKDIACTVLKNCWEFVAVFLACIGQGGAISPASALFTNAELKQQFKDSHSKIVFCSQESLSTVYEAAKDLPQLRTIIVVGDSEQRLPSGVINFNTILKNKVNGVKFFENIDVNRDLISLPYSSGTTGKPKGVMLTHKSFGTLLQIASKHFNEQIIFKIDKNFKFESEYLLHLLPFYHIYGFGMLNYGVLNGGQSVIMQKFEPELLLQCIEKYKLKFVGLVPPIILWLSKTPLVKKYNLSSLKFLMSGAAPLGKEVVDAVHKNLPNVSQVSQAYGLTEESMCSHLPVFGKENYAAAGRLISNYEQKIVCLETGKPLPIGKTGEVCIRSPTLMLGYFNRPDATKECMDSEGFLKTGDIGYQDENGWTYIVDRLKELIKVKGLQVAPAELEDLLLSNPKIQDCCVIGVKDAKAGEVPKAFVVKADQSLTEDEVKKYVAGKVASYKQLAGGVEFIKEIPKSPSGKILRRYLRDKTAKL